MTGIFKEHDVACGYHESAPYNRSTMRSVFHVRDYEVQRLALLTGAVDIMLSHDWPRAVYHYGDTGRLLRNKPFFRDEVRTNTLGNPAAEFLLHRLQVRAVAALLVATLDTHSLC